MYKDRFNPFGLDLLGVDFFKIKKMYLYLCMCVCEHKCYILRGQKGVLDVLELE